MQRRDRRLLIAGCLALAGLFVVPWYNFYPGLLSTEWLGSFPLGADVAPAVVQLFEVGRWWLLPYVVPVILAGLAFATSDQTKRANLLIWAGAIGISWFLLEGFSIGLRGWNFSFLAAIFRDLPEGQSAKGLGGGLFALASLLLLSFGLAERGAMRGDAFIVGAIIILIALVATFVIYPIASIFIGAFQTFTGAFDSTAFVRNITDPAIWSLDCLVGPRSCGVAWRTLTLALCTAAGTTVLGLAFALVATRTRFPFKRGLRLITVLPIITPPFVIGLALILLFGRSGVITEFVADLLGLEAGRWLYGLTGIWIAQMLSFTPIAFLVLIGVVEGVSPAMEEASQTLRADRSRTFWTVSLPLMRSGIANAFLIGFIESMADFGNPLVLGASQGVLSTEIFFAVVGAQNDPARAAVLALVLLTFTLTAFFIQRAWLKGKDFTTITGKADSGIHAGLSPQMAATCYALVVPWLIFTLTVYAMIMFGGFVRTWGLDHTFTLEHFAQAFSVVVDASGIRWTGVAWDSFWTTMEIAALAAPLTAAVGLLAAYLIVRQKFWGKQVFEFALMLSFAIPGTVIGISYVLAFNLPPIELTGTAAILVICFVFRNMPVGVRGGIAAMSQLDKSLDEASLTLGARSSTTLRRVILPLLRPAIFSALVYSFVRSITSISAVIFLVSAQYNMATAYIVGLVENGEYGVAIAYSAALIVVMIGIIASFQLLVGRRRLRREDRVAQRKAGAVAATPRERTI
ncbi:ABC transporter permease [Jiella marina]|uniref:ABC transporter permease n=1 Tax=Jiella sp. LLJ827 TaxID=2917712 RepID=UPI0021012037|nr:iron ABC transporter permease [Jiella sp. LLJ827]MCQ0988749.1 iron ABC transporter permease [Jiella sp. LLJ827]